MSIIMTISPINSLLTVFSSMCLFATLPAAPPRIPTETIRTSSMISNVGTVRVTSVL